MFQMIHKKVLGKSVCVLELLNIMLKSHMYSLLLLRQLILFTCIRIQQDKMLKQHFLKKIKFLKMSKENCINLIFVIIELERLKEVNK